MYYRNLTVVIIVFLCYYQLSAQIPHNLTKSDSTTVELFNYIIRPTEQKKPQGIVVLFVGLYDHPYSVFFESDIVPYMTNKGYTVLLPVLSKDNRSFDLSEKSCRAVIDLIQKFINDENLNRDAKVVLGGFSLGGTRAMKVLLSDLWRYRLNITHVFAIDPPLDLRRLFDSERKYGRYELEEAFVKEYGQDSISSMSIYTDRLDKTTLHVYEKTRLRIYNEPDMEWQIITKKRDLMDLNFLDQSLYINYVKRKSPVAEVELVLSKIKGVRKQTNERNPHSWNIVDLDDLLRWMEEPVY